MLPIGSAGAADMRSVEVRRDKGHIKVVSETYIDAPPAEVFEILADYEGFHRISKVFDETRYLERKADGSGLVYSRASGCVLFFCKTIERVERLEIEPGKRIVATALPEQSDVEYSVADWTFEAEGDGTRMMYRVDFKPDFWVPPVLGPLVLRSKLRRKGEEAAERIEALALQEARAASSANVR
ncbi:MAG: SRPBCC family protein [Gammaproteobacteria bacterium]|nr:SRPBCC family protein [Gammaproteobacteria bacterium]